jgi:hypothetical protein
MHLPLFVSVRERALRVVALALTCTLSLAAALFAAPRQSVAGEIGRVTDEGGAVALVAPSTWAEVQAEQRLVLEATKTASAGNADLAWKTIVADVADDATSKAGVSPARLGWRAASVAGFLRNQGKYVEADRFARIALSAPWCDLDRIAERKERAEVLYWCAWLASEVVGERTLALEWLAKADLDDPDSERIIDLRLRLIEAEQAFPSARKQEGKR